MCFLMVDKPEQFDASKVGGTAKLMLNIGGEEENDDGDVGRGGDVGDGYDIALVYHDNHNVDGVDNEVSGNTNDGVFFLC